MKTFIAGIFIAALLVGCKATEKLSKEEIIANTTEKVEGQHYTFLAERAIPMGGKSINLNYNYNLKVSKDTVTAYLPYFGRAYVAPTSSDDSGIKFTSTDFEYTTSDKKKGMWNISIKIKDNQKGYQLSLNIGDNGRATLNVHDNQRQSITFYGQME